MGHRLGIEVLDLNVPKLDLHRWARMQLQGQQPPITPRVGILVRALGRLHTVDEMLEMMALGVDAIMTDRPVLLQELLDTPAAERSCD